MTVGTHVAPALPEPEPEPRHGRSRHDRSGSGSGSGRGRVSGSGNHAGLVRSSPWLPRAVLLVIAALAGLSYAWAISRDPLEPYYAAAVRSMSMSWHDFFFGAFDPGRDDHPRQAPRRLLGAGAVGPRLRVPHLGHRAAPGRRGRAHRAGAVPGRAPAWPGPAPGWSPPLVVAVSPATVALNRGNISDSLMILLLVLAADAVSQRHRPRPQRQACPGRPSGWGWPSRPR